MKFSPKKSMSKSRSKASLMRLRDRRRFRKAMFETLEDRRVLSTTPAPIDSWRSAEFVTNEAIVRFADGVTRAQAQQEVFMRTGGQVVNFWDVYHLAEIRFSNVSTNDVNMQLNQIAGVQSWNDVNFAEPNFIQHISEFPPVTQNIPNDTRFLDQYGLNNTGYGLSVPDADIDAPEAWLQTTGDSNIVIAVVDTGGDLLHPDLRANIWQNPGEIPGDGIDNDGNGFVDDVNGWDFVNNDNVPQDDNEHGTHVSGIIGAVGDNGIGVSGVAWNVKIMEVKAASAAGGLSIASILGSLFYINVMKNKGINIVAANHSYGGFGPPSLAQQAAMTANEALGILDVCAAGNSALDNDLTPHYPSSFPMPNIISVASTDRNDRLSTFSQWGETSVDLGAPGDGILSTVPLLGDPSGYKYLSGTSMATPMTTGALVLIKAFDPTLTATQLKDVLLRGTELIPALTRKVVTGGRLNVNNSLNLLQANVLSGTVFEDANANTRFDASETGLAGWTVYVDLNNNSALDVGEPRAVSAASGGWIIRTNIGPGVYNVREIVQPTYRQTFPTGGAPYQVTLLDRTSSVSKIDFGNQLLPGEIRGRKWNDLNGNGIMDPSEPGIQGVVVYVDINNDAKIGIGEPAAVTDQFGNYTIPNIRPGVYNVREVYQPGFIQVFPDPTTADLGANTGVVVASGVITTNINFGNKAAFDYGDAPAPYPTLKSQNGAVHGILQGFRLGATVDAEPDGQPSVGAIGDDFAGNETQRVTIPATTTAGTFTLTFGSQTTAPIVYNANAAAVRTALEALSNIGAGQVLVTGGPGPANSWLVTFQGTLANQNVAQLTGSGSSLTPAGVVTVATQQNGGIDDEDGVILGNLVPGQTATATVTSSVGSFAAGYLQAFVDFNRDGDWNDAGEQIFKDVQLTNGTVVLPFNVPASASLGLTYARFRFSLEHGIGPTGSALGGEVEDYATNILGTAPTAINDSFTVDDGSFLFQNALNVLANDLPSATGPAGIDPSGLDLTGTQGQVVLDDNGTAGDPTDDFYRYEPPAGFVGIDTFKYRDKDPSGNVSAPATVTVTVRFVPRDPIAVDNTFDVLVNSLAAVNKMDVIANDVQGTGGALRFLTQTPPTALHGTVTVDTNGTPANFNDDFYRYAPNAGYQGEDSFTYTVVDSLAKQSTAKVTVQVLAAPRTPFTGALIQFELQVVDKTTGLQIPDGALIPIGTSILVRGVISDIRPPGSAFDPSQGIDFAGAFSGYMDLLFDRSKVQAFGPIVFGSQYQDNRSGFGGTPGLIDEIGAAHLASTSPGNPAIVFTKEFLTVGSGVAQFIADPADVSPAHDITAFIVDPNPLNSKVQPIPPSQVYYKPTFPNISILGAGEGDDTNLWTPTDVNLDGFVTPIDALLVVNYLNEHLGDSGASGEGSTGVKRDVNHDNQISPIDALMVINYLNRPKPVVPAGEAEGEADDSAPLSPLVVSSTAQSGSGGTSNSSEPAAPVYAANVDRIFAETDWTRPSVNRSEDFVASQTGSDSDEFFADLGTAVRRNRKG